MVFLTMLMIIGIIGSLVGFVLLAGYFANQTKNTMFCIAFGDPRSLRDIQNELTRQNLNFTRTPNEIWVRRTDAERIKNLIASRYRIEITLTSILVFNRRDQAA